MSNIWQKIQKNLIVRVCAAYIMIGWVIMQIAEIMGPAFNMPDWVLSAAAFLLLTGLPVAILVTWTLQKKAVLQQEVPASAAAEAPASGVARPLDYVLFAGISFILVLIALRWISPDRMPAPEMTEMARTDVTLSDHEAVELTSSLGELGQDTPFDNSIAVMPFIDLSQTQDQEYFANGMTDELINALNNIGNLHVTGRTSSIVFKESAIDLREIGRTLRVAHILEGSVRKQGDQVRISAQLSDASTGFQIWSENFDGTLADVFRLQENIARSIAGEMNMLIGDGSDVLMQDPIIGNSEAFEIYLQAKHLLARPDPESVAQAINLLEEAIELDGSFTRAHSALAAAHLQSLPHRGDHADKLLNAELSAKRAIGISDTEAEPHAVLGTIDVHQRNFLEMQAHFQTALDLDDGDLSTLIGYTQGLIAAGKAAEATDLIRRAIARDPVSAEPHFYLATLHLITGEVALARRHAATATELGFRSGPLLADLEQLGGNNAGAAEIGGSHIARRHGDSLNADQAARLASAIYQQDADPAAAVQLIREALRQPDKATFIHFPSYLVKLDQPELALQVFEENEFAVDMPFWVVVWSPFGATTRAHPEFRGFARRIGLVDYWQEHGWPDYCQPLDTQTQAGSEIEFSCS